MEHPEQTGLSNECNACLPIALRGTCLLHPEPFRLQSEHGSLVSQDHLGSECIQGLRWSTIMIDSIAVTDSQKPDNW